MANRYIGKIFRVLRKVVKWFFIILFLFILSLLFRDQKLPRSWLDGITRNMSSDEMLVRCDSADFGFRNGVTLRGIRVYDLTATNEFSTIASASSVSVCPLRRLVRIVGARYPRLPESYYQPGYMEKNEPLELTLPELPVFRLELVNPVILGLAPEKVTAQAKVLRNYISLDEAHVEWPGNSRRISEDGYFHIDLAGQRAHGEVRGIATQEHIRPLIDTLDVPKALAYFDAFTGVPTPVDAKGEFDVNLINNDFRMILDLRPELGRYNGVEMARAEGKLDLDVRTRGTNMTVRFRVDLPVALDPKGRQLSGGIGLVMSNDVVRLDFSAVSKLMLPDILGIVDVMEPETLDFIKCETAPEITADGHIATCIEDIDWNDIAGGARFWRGSVFGFQTRSLSLDWSLNRDALTLANIRARGKSGGEIEGSALIRMPGFEESDMTFAASGEYKGGSIEELADIFGMDPADKNGIVNSEFEISGSLATNVTAGLNGRGWVRVTDGRLLQMNIFAGLTELLAQHVPGIDYIVNQSQASIDFSISNGVFRTENLFIEGGLVSLKGWGAYDMTEDQLDFTVRAQFLKNESFMGSIVHPVTWPFTKLLLEFKASGSIREPKWRYISVLDRIF